MARWRLTNPHYLDVPGTEWEYKELDRATGKQARKTWPVPLFLHPNDPSDCNYPGEIIVANKASTAYPKDIIFAGEPTPDMEPLDDEARAISDSFADKWVHPIESLPGGFSASLLSDLEKQITAAVAAGAKPQAISTPGVAVDDFKALQAQVAALAARNAELEAGAEATPPKAALRRA